MSDPTKIDDGGPAFPWNDPERTEGLPSVSSGMSLRDYFAAKAPAPPVWWLENWNAREQSKARAKDTYIMRGPLQADAEFAYQWADARLKARNTNV